MLVLFPHQLDLFNLIVNLIQQVNFYLCVLKSDSWAQSAGHEQNMHLFVFYKQLWEIRYICYLLLIVVIIGEVNHHLAPSSLVPTKLQL